MIVPIIYDYQFYFISIFLYVFIFYFYYFNTKFSKTITVKKEFLNGHPKNILNVISDTDNIVYSIENKILLFKFNSTENLSLIKPNKKVSIKGYGVRVPFLDLYPIIIDVQDVK